VSLKIENVDYEKLSADDLDQLSLKVGVTLARLANVDPSKVHVTLTKGSVKVDAVIDKSSNESNQTQFEPEESLDASTVAKEVNEVAKSVPGVANAATGDMTVGTVHIKQKDHKRKEEEERIAAERKAEEERLAAEKAEQDRIAAEKKAEEERLAAEKAKKAEEQALLEDANEFSERDFNHLAEEVKKAPVKTSQPDEEETPSGEAPRAVAAAPVASGGGGCCVIC